MIRDNDMINIFDVERVLGDLPIDIIKENLNNENININNINIIIITK